MISHDVALAVHPSSARTARRFVRSCLNGTSSPVVDTAELLVSEVVTNSVRHADGHERSGTIELRLAVDDHVLRIEVTDDDPAMPMVRSPDAATPSGRGMLIVDRLADRWGCSRAGVGKVVWLELARSPTSRESRTADRWRCAAEHGDP